MFNTVRTSPRFPRHPAFLPFVKEDREDAQSAEAEENGDGLRYQRPTLLRFCDEHTQAQKAIVIAPGIFQSMKQYRVE